jgi:hypothetical protein
LRFVKPREGMVTMTKFAATEALSAAARRVDLNCMIAGVLCSKVGLCREIVGRWVVVDGIVMEVG